MHDPTDCWNCGTNCDTHVVNVLDANATTTHAYYACPACGPRPTNRRSAP